MAESAPPVETPKELKTVTDHKYISLICHESGCQYLVLMHVIRELLDMAPFARNDYEQALHNRAKLLLEKCNCIEGVNF